MKKFLFTLLFWAFAATVSAQTITSVDYTCDRCGPVDGSGLGTPITTPTAATNTGTNFSTWSIPNLNLRAGVNTFVITTHRSDGAVNSVTQVINYTPTFPGNALVAAYAFDTGSGGTAFDSSGVVPANNGTLFNGVAWTSSGHSSNALSFDGVDDYVQVADSNSLDLTQGFTISAWVFPTVIDSSFRAIAVKNYVQYLYATEPGNFCTGGGVIAGFQPNGNKLPPTSFNVCDSTNHTVLQTNIWTHLAVTYDGTTLKLYRNGAVLASTSAVGLMEGTTGSLQIGASTFGEYFQGRIDDLRVYNYAIPRCADAGACVSGNNISPGAACVFGNPLLVAEQSVVRDMNCPVIAIPTTPPLPIKFPASATGLKLGSNITTKLGH